MRDEIYNVAQANLSRENFYRFLLRQALNDVNNRPSLSLEEVER